MAPARQRVSYVIPSPTDPVPRLQLPPYGLSRLGSTKPLLIPLEGPGNDPLSRSTESPHPRHRLGVASLALDKSTQLAGRCTPEGILYTAGRDGLVISWDLELPVRQRSKEAVNTHKNRWEVMTGWEDDVIDEENEDESDDGLYNYGSDGDVLGEVTDNFRRRRRSSAKDLPPGERQWEMDMDSFESGKASKFRQCAQMHSDWVNDILLCNQNQTVVSASSDGTIKAWNPHSNASSSPSVVGSHSDYVRCLSHCRDQNWIASGSFDRTIKLWDVNRPSSSGSNALITLKSPENSAPKASVYALAVDPYGSVVASGSPERVIRTWDPRSGKRTNKLVGHTDNIRAILISDDARYLLTGSADASVKLWSLASQRCIHTFTQHTESVWSLFSSHPSLEIFYSGDRSGLVCRVDVEGCSDVSEGECVVLCQDTSDRTMASTEGINKMVAVDDDLLWTASGSSSIKRWKMPQRRAIRAPAAYSGKDVDNTTSLSSLRGISQRKNHSASIDTVATTRTLTPPPTDSTWLATEPSIVGSIFTENVVDGEGMLYGLPFESLVKLTSARESFTPFASMSRGRDPEVATLYSAASVMSVPRVAETKPHLSPVFLQPQQPRCHQNGSPIRSDTFSAKSSGGDEMVHPVNTARADYEEREVASEAVPLLGTPDYVVPGQNGLVRSVILNDRMHTLSVDTTGKVAVWDIVRCVCLGSFAREDVAAASLSGSTASRDGAEREQSPREALEIVRERVEGEAFVVPWSSVDTKTGLITVHLNEKCFEAEIYADEAGYGPEKHFNDENRLNIGKWVLRNLFIWFIREQQRALARRNREANGHHDQVHHRIVHRGSGSTHIDANGGNTSHTSRRRSDSDSSRHSIGPPSNVVLASPSMVPAVSPHVTNQRTSPLSTPMINLHPTSQDRFLPSIPHSPILSVGNDATPMPSRPPTAPHASGTPRESIDYFTQTQHSRSGSIVGTLSDDGGRTPSQDAISTPGGGLIGRLRNFTRPSSRRPQSEFGGIGVTIPVGVQTTPDLVSTSEDLSGVVKAPPTPLQLLLSNISIPPSNEAPGLPISPHTSILISEESTSGWIPTYRGSVAVTGVDVYLLEEMMPIWLLEYLLANKAPNIPMVKVSFVLLPFPSKNSDEQLPELLNTSQSKLTASRFLRVRKLTTHVQDKLERLIGGQNSSTVSSPRSSIDAHGKSSSPTSPTAKSRAPKAEDLFEILCNGTILPLDMTLVAVRQFVWRQASELIMHYRRKSPHT